MSRLKCKSLFTDIFLPVSCGIIESVEPNRASLSVSALSLILSLSRKCNRDVKEISKGFFFPIGSFKRIFLVSFLFALAVFSLCTCGVEPCNQDSRMYLRFSQLCFHTHTHTWTRMGCVHSVNKAVLIVLWCYLLCVTSSQHLAVSSPSLSIKL